MEVGKTEFRNSSAVMICLRAETEGAETLETEAFHNRAGLFNRREVSHHAAAVVVTAVAVVSDHITGTAIMAAAVLLVEGTAV
jgi:hypothetical protein